jgi:HK97 family phage major capsid protein
VNYAIDALRGADRTLWDEIYADALAETGDAQMAELAAWGAVRKAKIMLRRAGKSENGDDIVIGWGMLFTDENALDLDEQFFDGTTQLYLDVAGRGLFYEHGQDSIYGTAPIGERVMAKVFSRGIWTEHRLYPDHPQHNRTVREVDAGELSLSSDSVAHYVAQGYDEATGHLGTWNLYGWSLTRRPAEPGLGMVTLKAAMKSYQANQGQSTMKWMNALAKFFGVEETMDAVKSEMTDLIAQLAAVAEGDAATEDMTDQEKAALPDVRQLAVALGLGEGATPADVMARMQEVMTALAAEEGAVEGAASTKSYDYGALKGMQNVPVNRIGANVGKSNGANGAGKSPADSKKSNRYGAVPQVGKALKPSISAMVRDIKAGKAQSYQLGTTGGYLLNHEISSEIIPALRDTLPLMEMGVREFPMSGTESLSVPRVQSEMEAYWVGEGDEITDSEETYDTVTLVPKPLAARVIVPNKLLMNAAINYESQLRDDMTYRINRAIMRAALFGTGGGAQPLGIVNTPGVTITSLGTNGGVPTMQDMNDMIGRIEDAPIEQSETWAWLTSPRTRRTFTSMTDTNGQPILRDNWSSGERPDLLGINFYKSTVISNTDTVGSSTDCSKIFLADWRYLAIGLSNQIEIAVLDQTRASRLQTEIIAYTFVDVAVLREEAFEVDTGVRA